MNILIRGAGFENKGAEAMLRTVQREIGKRISNVSFYVFTAQNQAQVFNSSGIFAIVVTSSLRNKLLHSFPLSKIYTNNKLKRKNPDFACAIKISKTSAFQILKQNNFDVIIDISGYGYGDAWSVERCKNTWAWVKYCKNNNKPYIFLPQAWGAFENKDIAAWTRKNVENAKLFFARDYESKKYLSVLCEKKLSDLRMAPDIAFQFKGANKNVGESILHNLGFKFGKRPIIGLVPNMRVYERTVGEGSDNNYVKLLVEVANYCIEKLGASVLCLPNEIKVLGKSGHDDRFLCGIIQASVNKNEHCFTTRDYHYCETIKSILSNLDLLVASRFHSLVFGLSSGIPVMALGWSHKYVELLMGFGLKDYICNLDQLDKGVVTKKLDTIWADRENIKKKIITVLPGIQQEVDDMFNLVADAIAGKQNDW